MSKLTFPSGYSGGGLRPLRPLQTKTVEDIRNAILEGHRRIIVGAPCGFGKTLLSAHIIDGALRKARRVVFTCPAITLVAQTVKAFEAEGLRDIGVMQAQHIRTDRNARVQVASVQTLLKREIPEVDLLILDECHRHFKGLNELLDGPWQKKIAIGLSATPWVKGIGLRWTKLIIPATIPQLIDLGLLTSTKLYVPEEIANRQHIEVSNGQFVEESSAKEMCERRIVGNVVKTWKELGVPKTFLFAVNRDHAQQQMAAFIDGGIPWGYIDANTPQYERAIQFARMKRGENAGIASVGCLIAGVDEDVRCIIDCAPTKSEISLVQRWGRGIRTAEGKTALIGLDHAGNNTELGLGLFWEIHHDHLDTHKPGEKGVAYEGEPRPKKPRKCVICNALIEQGKAVCSACGEPVRSLGLEHEEGELVVYGTPKKAKSTEREYTAEEKRQWYGGMLWMAREGGKKDGLAWHAFFEKFGHYPAGYAKTAMEPTWEMEQWDRHRRIKWAKRRDKEAKSAERQETAAGDVRAELGAR